MLDVRVVVEEDDEDDGDLDEAEAAMEHHAGEYRSLGEFAEEFTEQSIDVPEPSVLHRP